MTVTDQIPTSAATQRISPPAVPAVSGAREVGHFLRHYGEMCAPMCIGFAVGDLIYFWAAGQFGYSEPFNELAELSVAIVSPRRDS